jgi:predicted permease
MKPLAFLRTVAAALLRRSRVESEMDEELRAHIRNRADDLERSGLPRAQAERRARVEFGGVERFKEECREALGTHFLETLVQDIRFGVRTLHKSPGFTLIAVLTLALGIGATTALFSVVNGVLLNPLPYKHPNRLVAIYSKTKDFRRFAISYPNFLDWVRDNHSFSALAAFLPEYFDLTGRGEPEQVQGERVSASFFPLLGVQPILGRQFTAKEDRLDGRPVVLLSGGFWKRKFGSARDVVGKTLTLNDTVYTIVGVMPANFSYGPSANFQANCDVFVPIGQWNNPIFRERQAAMGMDAVGRLKPGVTLVQARADMSLVAAHLAEQFPNADKDSGVTVIPLKQDFVGNVQPLLLILLAAVGFVLLIVCANVANLLLARSTGRAREFAIRAALGASQGRVIRQLLTESLLLSVAGGALGLLMAAWGTQAALSVLPEALPRASSVHLDGHVLFFALGVSILSGILFGLAPALRTRHVDLRETLKEGGRGGSGARHATQRIFVAVEMALAVVLLVGAGLMTRSLANLWSVNPGFDPHHVLFFSISSPRPLGGTPDDVRTAMRQIRRQLEAVPGVQAASLVAGSQPMWNDSELPFWVAGQPKPATQSQMSQALFYAVQPDYRKAMKIPLIRGRFLTAQDNEHSAPVIIIDQEFARLFFGHRNPIGQRIHLAIFDITPEIVGVVGHVKQWGLASAESSVQAQFYMPISQVPARFLPLLRTTPVVARTRAAPASEVAAIRRQLAQVNPDLVMFGAQPMESIISASLAARRFAMILLSVFAGIALLLSCIGIYGVISYLTSQRSHEVSIRIALGAQQRDVLAMVLGQGAKMALAGVGIGLAAALGLTWLMSHMLFGVSAHDPLTFLGVSVLLVLVALAACYVPARRASRVDPAMALRNE